MRLYLTCSCQTPTCPLCYCAGKDEENVRTLTYILIHASFWGQHFVFSECPGLTVVRNDNILRILSQNCALDLYFAFSLSILSIRYSTKIKASYKPYEQPKENTIRWTELQKIWTLGPTEQFCATLISLCDSSPTKHGRLAAIRTDKRPESQLRCQWQLLWLKKSK